MSVESNNIQMASSAPDYISAFLQTNMEKLQDIFEEGIHNFGSGCMMLQCSQETNDMNVQFMGDEMMCQILEKDSWFSLKDGIPESKKLFFVIRRQKNLFKLFKIRCGKISWSIFSSFTKKCI